MGLRPTVLPSRTQNSLCANKVKPVRILNPFILFPLSTATKVAGMCDAFLDPNTGDYTLASGSLLPDPARGLANAVYLRLMTPLGSYWADATLGSRLHELAREKDVERVAVLAKAYCETALAPLLDDGRATDITITTERKHDGWLRLAVAVTDAGGRDHLFNHHVRVI